MKFLSGLTTLLVILGGLNWLAVALGVNVVEELFGSWDWLVTTIYWLVGLAALYQIFDKFFGTGASVKSKAL